MRRRVSALLILIMVTGGSVYTRPEYRHLAEAARARREGWGKCKAEVVKTFDAAPADETNHPPALTGRPAASRYAAPDSLLCPGPLDRTLLRPPIAAVPLPA